MSQSTEEIEAKLAAFVDGELDAAGKAEIEKHLAANPQHRKLLEDLTQHRDLMRALPREKAPPEILESLQSHLERRLLLEESPEIAGRIGLGVWRQFMSVAAVLALVATLGILIYSVVPSSEVGSSELAHLEKSAPRTIEPAAPTADTDIKIAAAKPTDDRATVAIADMATRAAADALQPTTPPPASIGATGPLAMGGAPEPRLDRPTTDTPITLDREIAPSGAPPVVVLVADDTATAEREVAAVLTSNFVNFEHVTPPAMSRTIPTRDEIAESFARRGSATQPVTIDSALAADRDAGASRNDAAGAAAPGAVPNSALANAGPIAQNQKGETIFLARKVSRAQMQAVNDALNRRAELKQQQTPADVQQQYQAYAAARSNVLNDSALYSKDKLGSEQRSDFAEMAKKLSPTSQLAGTLITSGDELEIEIPQSQARARQMQKATVSPEGTVSVPELPEVAQIPAAGRTLEDYQSAVNEKLRAAAKEEQVVITRSPVELTDMLIVVRGGGVIEAPAESAPAAAPVMPSTAPTTTNPTTNPN